MAAVGVYLPQLRMDFGTIEARVLAAEEAGFHSAWFMDHLAPPAGPQLECLEAWTLATAIALRTTRIRIGHLVLCNPFRHPALLAKMAASLDVMSGGRLELGLGWGSVAAELRAFGFGEEGAARRSARLAETLEILELLFAGEPVSYTGRFTRLDGAVSRPRPVNGRVPIHLGGVGRRYTLPLVERFADWWNCPSYGVLDLDRLRPLVGDRARLSVQHPIGLARTSHEREAIRSQAERRFGGWGGVIAGTPDEVVDSLRREMEMGVELFVVQFSDFGTPATLRLFAEEVMPALDGRS